MDNNKFYGMLKNIMDKYNVTICENDVKKLLGISHFRVVCKGEILIGIDEPLKYTGLILDGITRSYYLDTDGNDVTKGFGIVGGLCMDEGLFGYDKSICACETIEDTTVMLMETKMLKELCMENNELKMYISISLNRHCTIRYTVRAVSLQATQPSVILHSEKSIRNYVNEQSSHILQPISELLPNHSAEFVKR